MQLRLHHPFEVIKCGVAPIPHFLKLAAAVCFFVFFHWGYTLSQPNTCPFGVLEWQILKYFISQFVALRSYGDNYS